MFTGNSFRSCSWIPSNETKPANNHLQNQTWWWTNTCAYCKL